MQELTTASSDPGFYSWSPDDSEIVLTDFGNSSLQIYKINSDGSGTVTPLTDNSDIDLAPYWSPVE